MNRKTHRLFFALLPDPSLVPALAQAADTVKATKLIRGSWVASSKYHVTLHFLGNYPALPEDIIGCAKAAAADVRLAPFEFALDSVSSFRGGQQSPCVLRCARDADIALQSFWRELGSALVAHGLGELIERWFIPHVTIAYGDKALAEPVALEPIVWSAADFVLVDSLLGTSIHHEMERWALAP